LHRRPDLGRTVDDVIGEGRVAIKHCRPLTPEQNEPSAMAGR
jgi:hypothetical protein